MIFTIGNYRLDIDVPRTKAYYMAEYDIGCDCAGCRNFEKAVRFLPKEARDFLQQFGVDASKPAELSTIHSPDGKQIVYDGFYHLCGKILEGAEPWVEISEKHLNERYKLQISDDYSFYFTANVYLLDENFPQPAIQLEFTGYLPWVLAEANPYHYRQRKQSL